MATKEKHLVSIDIGSSKVLTLVSLADEEPNIIGIGIAPTLGLRKGTVIDVEETISSISASIEQAERMSGVPINRAVVNINGSHITNINSRGAVAVGRADNEITAEDVFRAQEAAQAVSLPSNREIVHVFNRDFIVDGQEGIKDPIGMNGVRLEVDTHIITGSQPAIKNLLKCVSQAGILVEDKFVAPLASSKAVLTKRQKELGVVLIDIGAGTIGLMVFEEGNILYTAVLPIGANNLTNDIAIGFRTSIDIAEKIKLKYGHANLKTASEKDKINLKEFSNNEEGEFSQKYLAKIIEARLNEIFQIIKKELNKINKNGMLPAGAVITGGGAKLKGLVDYAKDDLHLPVQIGIPSSKGLVDKISDPSYACSVGLLMLSNEGYSSEGMNKKVIQIFNKTKKFFKTFLP